MKSTPAALLALAALGSGACSLVTVPVKVAGGIVETTVKTTGDVIAAPFNAVGGRGNAEKKEKTDTTKEAPTPTTEPND